MHSFVQSSIIAALNITAERLKYAFMAQGKYTIEKLDELILIRTTGNWTLALEVAYLAELSQVLVESKSSAYVIFVDMRGLKVPDSVKNTSIKSALHLDRRSQLAEYWVTENVADTDYLLPFFDAYTFPLYRLTDATEAVQAVATFLTDKSKHSLLMDWFNPTL